MSETKIGYDPKIHAGIVSASGKDFIIADASQAKLHEMPLDMRKELASSTKLALALVRGIGGILEPVNTSEEEIRIKEEGYRRGLALLQLSSDQPEEK